MNNPDRVKLLQEAAKPFILGLYFFDPDELVLYSPESKTYYRLKDPNKVYVDSLDSEGPNMHAITEDIFFNIVRQSDAELLAVIKTTKEAASKFEEESHVLNLIRKANEKFSFFNLSCLQEKYKDIPREPISITNFINYMADECLKNAKNAKKKANLDHNGIQNFLHFSLVAILYSANAKLIRFSTKSAIEIARKNGLTDREYLTKTLWNDFPSPFKEMLISGEINTIYEFCVVSDSF